MQDNRLMTSHKAYVFASSYSVPRESSLLVLYREPLVQREVIYLKESKPSHPRITPGVIQGRRKWRRMEEEIEYRVFFLSSITPTTLNCNQ